MEADAKYTYVGLAVVVLTALLLAGVVWLKQGGRGEFNYYTIYFERQPLDGLQIGADVLMRGIKVGRVDDYALTEDINRVRVEIRTDRRTPVSTNTEAVVTRNFVTGLAKIDLRTPNPPGPPLVSPGKNEEHPVIPEGASNIDAIANRLNLVGETAMDTLDRLNEVLSPQNRKAIDESLANLSSLTAALNQRLVEMQHTLKTVERAASDIGAASGRVGAFADNTSADLHLTLQQADRTLKDISEATVTVQQSANRLTRNVGGAVQASGDQITVAARELRSTADQLSRVLDRLQDPRAALLGPDAAQRGPGE